MNDGRYPLGTLLPAQRLLAQEFGVSRDTVQRVLKELAVEGWVSARQGSGTTVVRGQSPVSSFGGRRVSLDELMDEAFQKPEVTLDVFTLSSESLAFQIQRQELEIRSGRRPELRAITLRMLLPAEDLKDRLYPKAVKAEDDQGVWERHLDTVRLSTASIQGKLKGLIAEDLVPTVDIEIRHVKLNPTHKQYLVNGSAMLSAPYLPVKRRIYLVAQDRYVDAIDVLGVGAPLTYDVKDDDPQSQASEKVDNWRNWFDGTWDLLSDEAEGESA